MASKFGRMAMRLVLVVPLIGLWLAVQPGPVYACDCSGPYSPSEALEKADAVFLGRALLTGDITEFDVATVWKGPVQERLRVDGSGPCGFQFQEGEEYIVYAYYSEYYEGLGTGRCGRTTELAWGMGLEDIAELGEGERLGAGVNASTVEASGTSETSASGGGCSASRGAVDLAFVGLLVGLVCFGLRKRRAESG